MAILLAETLITLGAALQCWCQGQGHLSLHQQAANQLRRHLFCGAGEEGLGEELGERGGFGRWLCVEVLRDADGDRKMG